MNGFKLASFSLPPQIREGDVGNVLFSNLRNVGGDRYSCSEIIIAYQHYYLEICSTLEFMSDGELAFFDEDESDPDYGSYFNFTMRAISGQISKNTAFGGRFGNSALSSIDKVGNIKKISARYILGSLDRNRNEDLTHLGVTLFCELRTLEISPASQGIFNIDVAE